MRNPVCHQNTRPTQALEGLAELHLDKENGNGRWGDWSIGPAFLLGSGEWIDAGVSISDDYPYGIYVSGREPQMVYGTGRAQIRLSH